MMDYKKSLKIYRIPFDNKSYTYFGKIIEELLVEYQFKDKFNYIDCYKLKVGEYKYYNNKFSCFKRSKLN